MPNWLASLKSVCADLASPRDEPHARPFDAGDWGAIALIVAIGAALRLPGLGDWFMTGDDALDVIIAMAPSVQNVVYRTFAWNNGHPPLPYILLHYAIWNGDLGPWSLRALAWIPSVAAPAVFYMIGRWIVGSRAAAVLLGALLAVSFEVVSQAGQIRHYSLMLCLSGIAVLTLAWRGRHAFGRYAVAAILLLATGFEGSFLLLPLSLIWLGRAWDAEGDRSARRGWVVAHLVMALLMAAMIAAYLHFGGPSPTARMDAASAGGGVQAMLVALQRMAAGLVGPFGARGLVAALSLLAVWLGGAWMLWRDRRGALAAIIVVPPLIAFCGVAFAVYPIPGYRHALHVYPSLVIAAAVLVAAIERRASARAAIGVAITVACGVMLIATGGAMPSADAYRARNDQSEWVRSADWTAGTTRLAESRLPALLSMGERMRFLASSGLHEAWRVPAPVMGAVCTGQWEFRTPELLRLCLESIRDLPDRVATLAVFDPGPAAAEMEAALLRDACLPIERHERTGGVMYLEINGRAWRERQGTCLGDPPPLRR